MTPSMYVVCSEHICQSLRGWARAVGGMAGTGSTRKTEERSRELHRKSVELRAFVMCVRTPAVTAKLNTLYLLWKN